MSILQIFFLLLFLYAIRLGLVLGGSPGTRTFESTTAALVGISGAIAWFHATEKRRLLLPDVSDQGARALGHRIWAEPLTALTTIPFAWVGYVYWEISWLSYLFWLWFLKRRGRA